MGEEAVDPGHHAGQRGQHESDRHEAGERQRHRRRLSRPGRQQAQGHDDQRDLGGDGHAPTDPLHAAAVDGAGGDVAGVRRRQPERQRRQPQQHDRPHDQCVAIAHQRHAGGQRHDVAGDDGVAASGRDEAAVAQPEQEVHRDGGQQRGAQAQAQIDSERRRAVERLVPGQRRRQRADTADERAGQDDRRQPVVPAAQRHQTARQRPHDDQEGPYDLDGLRGINGGDGQGHDRHDDGDRDGDEADRGPQLGRRRGGIGTGPVGAAGRSPWRRVVMTLSVDLTSTRPARALPPSPWVVPAPPARSVGGAVTAGAGRHRRPGRPSCERCAGRRRLPAGRG